MENKINLVITESDPFDREPDSELDELLNEEYYPSSEDEESEDAESSDSEEDEEPKPLERTGVIYRLTAEGCDQCYIGSTVNLKRRIYNHENLFKKGVNQCTSKLILAYGNYTFTEIASLLYTDIKQLRRLEADIILEHGDKVVNIKGTKNCYSKEYNKNCRNTDSYKEFQKEYRMKDSYKNYIKDYKKVYNKKRIFCECCEKEISLATKARHFKSKSHISNLK